jgi:hypothetical protein
MIDEQLDRILPGQADLTDFMAVLEEKAPEKEKKGAKGKDDGLIRYWL